MTETLLQRVALRTLTAPDAIALRWVNAEAESQKSLSYLALDQAARRVIVRLQEQGIKRGDTVVLAFSPGLDFFVTFWGCLLGGVIATPVMPPFVRRDIAAFLNLVRHSEAKGVLCDRRLKRLLTTRAYQHKAGGVARGVRALFKQGSTSQDQPSFVELMRARWIDMSGATSSSEMSAIESSPQSPHNTAFIMYSSGSTRAPKGALTSLLNLDHQLAMNASILDDDQTHVSCWWAPHYHDYGLISGFLNVMYQGCEGVIASPFDFVQRPALWLDMLHKHRGTHTFGPDFGYQLLIKRTRPRERTRHTWDLSQLKVAMSAAEKVRSSTIEAFSTAFEPCGFQRSMFCPAYGLAEHTVGVTISPVGQEPSCQSFIRDSLERDGLAIAVSDERETPLENTRVIELVGNGAPERDIDVKIVRLDEEGEPIKTLQAGQVGEIWVSSPSATLGYFKEPELSKVTYHAHLPHQSPDLSSDLSSDLKSDLSYLRTGDQGFISAENGELFICGRQKDMIIISGKNHYSEDLEATLTAHMATWLRPGRIAAIAYEGQDDDQERLAVVAEARTDDLDRDALFNRVQRCLSEEHRVSVSSITLIRAGSIPKTSSGKLRRFKIRQDLMNDELEVIKDGTWRAPSASLKLTQDLESLCEEVIKAIKHISGHAGESVTADTQITDLNLSSLELMQLSEVLNISHPHRVILVRDLFGLKTIRDIAHLVAEDTSANSAQSHRAPPINAHANSVLPRVYEIAHPVTFSQSSILTHHFLSLQRGSEWTIPLRAWLDGPLNIDKLKASFVTIAQRQWALRTRFELKPDGSYEQWIDPQLSLNTFHIIDVDDDQEALRRGLKSTSIALDINLSVIRIDVYQVHATRALLQVMIHHTAADGWSVGILRDELIAAYGADSLQREEADHTSRLYQQIDVAYWQRELHRQSYFEPSLSYWRSALQRPIPYLQLEIERELRSATDGLVAPLTLSADHVRMLRDVAHRWNTSINVIFLTAYAAVLCRRYRQESLIVQVPVAGRTQEMRSIIGGFADATLIQIDVPWRTPVQSLVHTNHDHVYSALERWVPFSILVESLALTPQDLSRLSWVVLNVEQNVTSRDTQPYQMGDLELTPHQAPSVESTIMPAYAQSVMDLNLTASGSLIGQWAFKQTLITRGELDELSLRFCDVLETIAQTSSSSAQSRTQVHDISMNIPWLYDHEERSSQLDSQLDSQFDSSALFGESDSLFDDVNTSISEGHERTPQFSSADLFSDD